MYRDKAKFMVSGLFWALSLAGLFFKLHLLHAPSHAKTTGTHVEAIIATKAVVTIASITSVVVVTTVVNVGQGAQSVARKHSG